MEKPELGNSLACPFKDEMGATMRKAKADDPGIEKLQELLLGMAIGDEVSPARAAEITGLDPAQCEAVLDALVRAGLMIRLQHDAYVRCRLDDRGVGPESGV